MAASSVASTLLSLSSSSSSSPSPFLSSASFLPSPSSSSPRVSVASGRQKAAVSVLRALRAEVATLPVLSFSGDKVGEVALDLKSAPPSTARAVVHRALITDRQNKRRGTASTLTRGEVSGGGRKPYQQKKTGKARRGSMRTPLRPGGGVIFGPKPRDWSIKINRKEKRLAISTALASAALADSSWRSSTMSSPRVPRPGTSWLRFSGGGLTPSRRPCSSPRSLPTMCGSAAGTLAPSRC